MFPLNVRQICAKPTTVLYNRLIITEKLEMYSDIVEIFREQNGSLI